MTFPEDDLPMVGPGPPSGPQNDAAPCNCKYLTRRIMEFRIPQGGSHKKTPTAAGTTCEDQGTRASKGHPAERQERRTSFLTVWVAAQSVPTSTVIFPRSPPKREGKLQPKLE